MTSYCTLSPETSFKLDGFPESMGFVRLEKPVVPTPGFLGYHLILFPEAGMGLITGVDRLTPIERELVRLGKIRRYGVSIKWGAGWTDKAIPALPIRLSQREYLDLGGIVANMVLAGDCETRFAQ